VIANHHVHYAGLDRHPQVHVHGILSQQGQAHQRFLGGEESSVVDVVVVGIRPTIARRVPEHEFERSRRQDSLALIAVHHDTCGPGDRIQFGGSGRGRLGGQRKQQREYD
jgi:hypothetical protein